MEILIFKTDIRSKKRLRFVKKILDKHPDVMQWCVDREDIDNVLRIESSNTVTETDVINLMNLHGFYCKELPD